jgi:hypothetical protein
MAAIVRLLTEVARGKGGRPRKVHVEEGVEGGATAWGVRVAVGVGSGVGPVDAVGPLPFTNNSNGFK